MADRSAAQGQGLPDNLSDQAAARDQYVEALVKVGLDRAEAERRVADQRARGLLTEPPNPSECEYGCADGLLYDPRAEGNVVDCPACKVSRDRAGPDRSAAQGRVCPCCKGRRGRWQHFEVPDAPDSWDHAQNDETCECGPRFDPCPACKGTGELVGLARAVLLARGDIAPVQLRGHA